MESGLVKTILEIVGLRWRLQAILMEGGLVKTSLLVPLGLLMQELGPLRGISLEAGCRLDGCAGQLSRQQPAQRRRSFAAFF